MSKHHEPDWIIDAEITLYRGRGWTWEEIGHFFDMSPKQAKRRSERFVEVRQKRKESANG